MQVCFDDGRGVIVSVIGVLFDTQSPNTLWFNLVEGTKEAPNSHDYFWVQARYLPAKVEHVEFPRWAKAFMLDNPEDLVIDFLNCHPVKESAFGVMLKKAQMVTQMAAHSEDEEGDEEGDEEEEEEVETPKKKGAGNTYKHARASETKQSQPVCWC
jgi:hypothetical protein